MLYWIIDENDIWYVDRTHANTGYTHIMQCVERTHVHTHIYTVHMHVHTNSQLDTLSLTFAQLLWG